MELLSFRKDKQNCCKLKILFWPFTICILATTQNGNKYLHKAGERKKNSMRGKSFQMPGYKIKKKKCRQVT